jgi:predicted transcriptional regulator
MNPPSEAVQTATITSTLNFDRMVVALGHKRRWKILKELSAGEPRTIGEIATVAGCSYDNAAQHLKLMCKAGLIVVGRGHLYQIPRQYLPTPGQPIVDYGHCLLRIDATE